MWQQAHEERFGDYLCQVGSLTKASNLSLLRASEQEIIDKIQFSANYTELVLEYSTDNGWPGYEKTGQATNQEPLWPGEYTVTAEMSACETAGIVMSSAPVKVRIRWKRC